MDDIISEAGPDQPEATDCLVDTWEIMEEATVPRMGPARYEYCKKNDPSESVPPAAHP